MRQRHRAQRDLRKKMGISDFIPGWKIAGEQNDLNSFGCYEEKGPQGSRSRSRKASEDTDVIIQVAARGGLDCGGWRRWKEVGGFCIYFGRTHMSYGHPGCGR